MQSDQVQYIPVFSIDGVDVQVTQGVSQQTSYNVLSLADDLLQSQMMTIEDLIETSDVMFSYYFVYAVVSLNLCEHINSFFCTVQFAARLRGFAWDYLWN